jgi:hypothetical protein
LEKQVRNEEGKEIGETEMNMNRDDRAGQKRPPAFLKRRKMRLNLLLLGLCGSLFATKQPNGILPDPPPGVANNVTVTVCPDTGKVFFTHNAGSAGHQPGVPRGDPPEPPRVVFQSAVPANGGAPVSFTNENISVQTVMLATKATAADLATLIDVTVPYSREVARLRVAHGGMPAPRMTAAERQLTGQFGPGDWGEWRVVLIEFQDPVPLDALHFGNSAGRAAWMRGWGGPVKEIVCFSAPPCEDIRAGTCNYLAIRWGFAGHPYTATLAQRQAAIDAGLKYGVAWSTLIMIR